MSEDQVYREFTIPEVKGLPANLAQYWSFAACLDQWVELDGGFAKTSKQVIAHRLFAAMEGVKVVRWLERDWEYVCQRLETSEADFVPKLQQTDADGENPRPLAPPAAVGRLYVGSILGAKRVSEADDPVNHDAMPVEAIDIEAPEVVAA